MPCYTPEPTPEEIADSDRKFNLKKYGFSMTNSELIPHLLNMCCEMGTVIDCHFLLDQLEPSTVNWFLGHKERDRVKRKQEIREKLSNLKKEENNLSKKLNQMDDEIAKLQGQLASL